MNKMIRIVLTKGRIEKECVKLFEKIGFDCGILKEKGRRLILPMNGMRNTDFQTDFQIVLAKPADVITYVSHGACDIGIVGKDTIAEMGGKFYEVKDLKIGKCRFAVAAKTGTDPYGGYGHKVIATKYPNVAWNFFAGKGMDIEVIKIEGSVEIAPLIGFADAIVDIVETGATLKENGLEVIEYIMDISARVIVNTASMKLRSKEIKEFLDLL
jgi:ATP phosphoribosyltransferase